MIPLKDSGTVSPGDKASRLTKCSPFSSYHTVNFLSIDILMGALILTWTQERRRRGFIV